MAENYEGEATGYPSEVEMETQETPSPNFVVTLNSLAGAPRLVDGDGNDFPTDDETGVITIDTGGDSGNTVHYTVQTPTAPEKLIARTNIGVGQADSPAIEALRLNSDGSYVTPDGNVNTSISTDNAQHRTLMLGVNRELAAGGAGTVLDATRGGWSFNLELDYLAQDMTTFVGHGTLQNEFYIETAGSERVFLGGYSATMPVTVDSVVDVGANVLVTLNAASLAATGLSNYLQKGMRFYFTTVNGGSGIAINTPYRVFSVESSNTFHLATGSETLTAMTAGSMTSGVMNRGGWGQVGFYYPVGVASGEYRGAQSEQIHFTEPLFFVSNTKAAHHSEIAILNAAADSHQAYVNFDDKWRAGNGAIYGNLSTSFDISSVDFGVMVAWSMNLTTGHVKMGYNSDAFSVAPLSMLDVNGTVTALQFVGGGAGLTGLDAGDISAGTLAVARGGTGVSTSGTTSEIPVGGGTGSPIVWTTATGTGAPVRAGGPTFTGTTIVADFQITGAFNAAGATGVFTLNPDNQGSINNMNVGQTTARAGAFTIAAATSLALGGATIGSNALAVTGTSIFSSTATFSGSIIGPGATPVTISNASIATSGTNGDFSINCGSAFSLLLKTGGSTRMGIGNGGLITVTNTTDSTTKDTGSIVTEGGIGVEKAVTIGTTLGVTGNATFSAAVVNSVQGLSGAGAVDVITNTTKLTTTGIADALTLADGVNGQRKEIIYAAEGAGTDSAVLTPTTKTGFSTITFAAIGNAVVLRFLTTQGWMVVSNYGATVTP